jgi:hypothetical protein
MRYVISHLAKNSLIEVIVVTCGILKSRILKDQDWSLVITLADLFVIIRHHIS